MKELMPFFSFYGSKWRAVPKYPVPQHSTIIEPFAGSAGYSLRYPNKKVILVEKDPKIAALWNYLIHVKSGEILRLPIFANYQIVDDFDLCDEAKWLIGFWLNIATLNPRKRPSAWMRQAQNKRGVGNCTNRWGYSIRERIAKQLPYIRHWNVIHGDYTMAPDIKATWFIDPPYVKAGVHYKYSAKNLDFGSLGQWCKSRSGQVVVCEGPEANWLPFSFLSDVQAATGKYRRGKSKEYIWYKETT